MIAATWRGPIRPGDIYVLDQHDRHYLRGGKDQDLILVSVFNPPLKGDERHNLNDASGSAY
ncbi:ectoine synthase [Pseudomonas sp. NFACC37-1]|uniref:ectoine synthase n=1 Tax=Pseudomonas sp. NFACC37-1 TaxID=1566196 RepID=UPI00211487DA|nr:MULTISPECIES: ectoine synthase [unclassified Pseudomonas]